MAKIARREATTFQAFIGEKYWRTVKATLTRVPTSRNKGMPETVSRYRPASVRN